MDEVKCTLLKAELIAQTAPQIVSIERFFDGNDDLGSIGCNLTEHPGIDTFRNVLVGLLSRHDIKAVYAQISELDPGDGCWAFTDTIFVVGTISINELNSILSLLEPNEVCSGEQFGIPSFIQQKHQEPVSVVWWD